jgi:hypothetical protein
MKNRLFLLLVIIAVVGIAVALNYGKVWAELDVDPELVFDSTKANEKAEFSNHFDRRAIAGGGDIDGLDALQVLFDRDLPAMQGPPWPCDDDNLDFDGLDDEEGEQVDGLANMRDANFGQLIANLAPLLVSFECDSIPGVLYGDPYCTKPTGWGRIAVFIEYVVGNRENDPRWAQFHFNQPNPYPGHLEDLDGLQLWSGGEGFANMHSETGDARLFGGIPYSVIFQSAAGATSGYVPWSDIVAAVQAASLDTDQVNHLGHYVGSTSLIDLDALMVKDNLDLVWNDGDTIIFSIRNTKPAGNWDGGEIVVLPHWTPPALPTPFYLSHGTGNQRHLWHTAFPVAQKFELVPATEDVNAIEADRIPPGLGVPTLTQWGLVILVSLLITSAVFVMLKRRKAAVPA